MYSIAIVIIPIFLFVTYIPLMTQYPLAGTFVLNHGHLNLPSPRRSRVLFLSWVAWVWGCGNVYLTQSLPNLVPNSVPTQPHTQLSSCPTSYPTQFLSDLVPNSIPALNLIPNSVPALNLVPNSVPALNLVPNSVPALSLVPYPCFQK